MRQEVPVEREAAGERPATLGACKGPLAHVALEVSHERVLVCECHGAEGAAEGTGPRVRVHVFLEHILARERLGAHPTPEGPLTRVRAHVDHHVPLVARGVLAAVAVECLAPCVERPPDTCHRSACKRDQLSAVLRPCRQGTKNKATAQTDLFTRWQTCHAGKSVLAGMITLC